MPALGVNMVTLINKNFKVKCAKKVYFPLTKSNLILLSKK